MHVSNINKLEQQLVEILHDKGYSIVNSIQQMTNKESQGNL